MENPTDWKEIEVISSKADFLKKLITAFSDGRIRDSLFDDPKQCKSTLKQLLSCFPIDKKQEEKISKQLAATIAFRKLSTAIVPHVIIFIQNEKINIKDENYFENFIPYIAQFKSLEIDYGNKFTNGFVKSIFNFNNYVAPNNSKYKLHKLTGYICQSLGVLEKELSDAELVDKVKNIMKTTTSKDIFLDQLEKNSLRIEDSTDPMGYNTFLGKTH